MTFNKDRRGFTLIEVLIALAITALIVSVVTMSIFQVFDINARSSSRMIAVKQVQNAGYWISHDARMIQQEPVIEKVDGHLESITLTWTDLDGSVNHVVYTILEGGRLQRSHSVNDEESSESIVAKNIDLNDCTFTDGALALTITATSQEASETREYEIMPRPSL